MNYGLLQLFNLSTKSANGQKPKANSSAEGGMMDNEQWTMNNE